MTFFSSFFIFFLRNRQKVLVAVKEREHKNGIEALMQTVENLENYFINIMIIDEIHANDF